MENLKENKLTIILVLVALVAFLLFGFVYLGGGGGELATDLNQNDIVADSFPRTLTTNPTVTLKTTMGDISLEIYMDKTPITAGNFLKLAEEGFYTGTKFHRVINNFMIQGGDPNSRGDDLSTYGRGGPGYTIEDEFNPELSNLRGTIAMANIGQPHTGGSQFFINFTNNVSLDFDKEPFTSKHPIFGHVISGMDVVDAIIKVETVGQDLPLEPIVIEDVLIYRPDGGSESTTGGEVNGTDGTSDDGQDSSDSEVIE